MLSMMVSGKLFGELAILYNCKRWANHWNFFTLSFFQDGNNQGGNKLQAVGNWQGKLPDNHDAIWLGEADKVHLLPQRGQPEFLTVNQCIFLKFMFKYFFSRCRHSRGYLRRPWSRLQMYLRSTPTKRGSASSDRWPPCTCIFIVKWNLDFPCLFNQKCCQPFYIKIYS